LPQNRLLKIDKSPLLCIAIRYVIAAGDGSVAKEVRAAVNAIKVLSVGISLVALTLTSAFAVAPDTLSRRASLGVGLEAGIGGPKLRSVAPGSTAESAGLKVGDTVTALNGTKVANQAELVAEAGKLRAGDSARFTYVRDGASAEASAPALARPMETYKAAQATYGSVPFRGGKLRDIFVSPEKANATGPVVYFVQGYYCATVEGSSPDHPYRQFIQGLADSGIATYRVEKPGMGDSLGGPACLDTDFDTEMEAFRAGYRALTQTYNIDPARIVIFGHSMGGVQAPILAAEAKTVRGVAVYGTVVRNWHDYMQDLMRLQSFYAQGADPAESEKLAEAMRLLLNRIFMETTPLSEIAAQDPQNEALLKQVLEWDGKETFLARTASYWRGVSNQRLAAEWAKVKAPVLAIYGEADFAAIDDRDHRLVAEIANHYRPGSGSFIVLPKSGHGFGLEGDRAAAREATKANGGIAPSAPYNPELTALLSKWILDLKDPKAG
jgi:pimeloyl-ACP methyl ester carboxylesterase